jgi:hypothetical protein
MRRIVEDLDIFQRDIYLWPEWGGGRFSLECIVGANTLRHMFMVKVAKPGRETRR